MNKKGNFLTITGGVLALTIALLVTFNYSASSQEIVKKSSEYINVETDVKDSAIKTFDININNEKVIRNSELFNDKLETVSADLRSKLITALTMLTDDKTFVPGDKVPVYFLEGNKVSIAIEHADGTISLTKIDISKTEPVKIDSITRGVKK